MMVFPLVLGPGNVPVVTDPDQAAEDLPLAVFTALAHAKDPVLPAILDALAAAVVNAGDGSGKRWAEFTEIGLGDTRARALWRHLMATYTPRFPGSGTLIEETLIEGESKGRAKGRAEDILRILDLRGVEVAEADRERITACADLGTLGTWFDRAVTATSAQELFADE
ncbi:hypothetical protein ACWDFR_29835 [Streptomyces sp. 900105755]|uniref:hypothetical protein n=1 Tax=Streptomyces sp. NPDC001507 TaxID=3364579 RepID=UPI00369E6CDE